VLTFFMNVPGRTEIQRELDEQGQVRLTGSYQPLVACIAGRIAKSMDARR
jgi:hypothetical protein